jgi:Transglycosylase-like domain/LysM domain
MVRPGDSLSGIAARHCGGKGQDWTGIYAASHLHGNADIIQPGQQLAVDCVYLPGELGKATTIYRPATVTSANTTAVVQTPRSAASTRDGDGDSDHDSSDVPQQAVPATVSYGNASPAGYGGMQQCIISRESGGDSQVMNASGHYGLYQFSASTWAAHGGNPADFGHASVAEQNAVYSATVAADGYSDWSPYDGC